MRAEEYRLKVYHQVLAPADVGIPSASVMANTRPYGSVSPQTDIPVLIRYLPELPIFGTGRIRTQTG
jgi:hypothetical protein